ncbi:MAG: helix-turn-helix transcriptional regulator [Bacteroidetes bacterium]|nr:helix-turn-helix transcriptional regulator [Fibrella sp.]
MATLLLYGQSTRYTQLHLPDPSSPLSLWGICFQPDALKTVFGLDAHDLTDACIDAQDLTRNRATYRLDRLLQPSPANPVERLFTDLTKQVGRKNQSADPLVVQAVTLMVGQGGNVSLKKLQDSLRVSERSLERRFKQHVGISPKLFARICRFQTSLNQLKTKKYDKLSDIAFDGGYADQSHFTRTFKEFTGILPQQYHVQAHGLMGEFPPLVC